jgi:hypothetical protein
MFPRQANPHFTRSQHELVSVSRSEALERDDTSLNYTQETTGWLLDQFKESFDGVFAVDNEEYPKRPRVAAASNIETKHGACLAFNIKITLIH